MIDELLANEPAAAVLPVSIPVGLPRRHGWQLVPTDPETDGFYYALVGKRST